MRYRLIGWVVYFVVLISSVFASGVYFDDDYGVVGGSDFYDSYPYFELSQANISAVGHEEDTVIWSGDSAVVGYDDSSAYLQMVCFDIDFDTELDACINRGDTGLHYDPDACISYFSEIGDLNDSDSDRIYVNDDNVTGDFYFGENGVALLVDDGVSNNNDWIDSDVAQKRDVDIYQYYDCEDFRGERDDGNSGTLTVRVVDGKGQECLDGSSGRSYFSYDSTKRTTVTFDCSHLVDGYNVGFCNGSLNHTETSKEVKFAVQDLGWEYEGFPQWLPLLCYEDLSVLPVNGSEVSCYNGVLDVSLNETDVDYGGNVCGFCVNDSVWDDDIRYQMVRGVFPDDYYSVDNPFNPVDCDEAEEKVFSSVVVVGGLIVGFMVMFFMVLLVLLVWYLFFGIAVVRGVRKVVKRFGNSVK